MPIGEEKEGHLSTRRVAKTVAGVSAGHLWGLMVLAAYFCCMFVDFATFTQSAGIAYLVYLAYSLSLPLVVVALSSMAMWDVLTGLVRSLGDGRVGSWSRGLSALWVVGLSLFLILSAMFRISYDRNLSRGNAVDFPFGLMSQADADDVRRALHLDSLPRATYEAVYPSRWWGPCPRYEERHFAFGEYGFRGVAGNLEGMFLNGHLYQVVLFIRDGADRRRMADELVGVGQDTAVSSTPGASVRVSGAGVVWTDVRLERGVSALFWFCLPRSEWFVP